MKSMLVCLLALCMVLSIVGCTFSAAPPPTEPSKTAPTGTVTEPSFSEPSATLPPVTNGTAMTWADHPVASQFPQPPAEEFYSEVTITIDEVPMDSAAQVVAGGYLYLYSQGVTAWYRGTTCADMRAYMESFRQNGYDHYVLLQEDEQQEAFYFAAMNDAGDFVSMNYQFLEADFPPYYEFESLRAFQGYVTVVKNDTPNPMSSENQAWDTNEYQKLLPKPAYNFEDFGVVGDPSGGESWYILSVEGGNYWNTVDYVKQLQDAGFTLHQTEMAVPYAMRYEWIGENEEGYLVKVYTQVFQKPSGVERSFNIRVESPETNLNRGWTAWFIPDPGDVPWSGRSTDYTTGADWYYEWEWDFQQAREYAQKLRPFGYKSEVESKIDTAAETVYFSGIGFSYSDRYGNTLLRIIFQYKDGKCTVITSQDVE